MEVYLANLLSRLWYLIHQVIYKVEIKQKEEIVFKFVEKMYQLTIARTMKKNYNTIHSHICMNCDGKIIKWRRDTVAFIYQKLI